MRRNIRNSNKSVLKYSNNGYFLLMVTVYMALCNVNKNYFTQSS